MAKKILIVEDDADISMVEEAYLRSAGYETRILDNGRDVAPALEQDDYDLILLDLMLPGENGYEVCREIRDKVDIPILMVTARTESLDKIRGLGLGADDYIAKPFDPAELVARVSANLRQYERLRRPVLAGKDIPAAQNPRTQTLPEYNSQGTQGSRTQVSPDSGGQGTGYSDGKAPGAMGQDGGQLLQNVPAEVRIQDLRILPDSWKVYKKGKEIRFPNREFEILKLLAMNPDIVFSKEQIFEKVWGVDYMDDSATVMVHIGRIRDKIEDDPKNPKILETVRGAGYRINR